MSFDKQGRGSYLDEARIEKIAKRAKENGGISGISKAIKDETGASSNEIEAIKSQIYSQVVKLLR